MSIAHLRRDVAELQRMVGPRDIVEAWVCFHPGPFDEDNPLPSYRMPDDEKVFRGCPYGTGQAVEIDAEALRRHWTDLEERGYQVQAWIFEDANLTQIYITGTGYVDPHATATS